MTLFDKRTKRLPTRTRVHGAMVSLLFLPAAGHAETNRPHEGWYGSVFGGVGGGASQDARQSGRAHLRGDHALPGFKDFDLVVDGRGRARQGRSGLLGVHIGYRFARRDSGIVPAVELEGMHVSSRQTAHLRNPLASGVANIGSDASQAEREDPTSVVKDKFGPGEHRFSNRMHTDVRTAMLNLVLAYETGGFVEPYLGLGIGVAKLDAGRAVSYQTHPSGPIELTPDTGEKVNHFNSRNRASDIALAWQAKAGLRARMTRHVSAFVEYRMVRTGPADFTFGSTRYAGHAPTDHWRVKHGPMRTHSGVLGVQYAL
ncbi:outer membrane protein [Luteibacter yeojuensis]|uniref:Outer membrane protein with beta-barrel domain n=1 Tax=Luteibacter yeojuensis TaxID=345309 RepID=A0A7X5QWB5_9GAMM|nr:outer membrane beta-barrel protein [Luteibacter yeojuensis]NID16566.1 hypothetical protein [Luteibacter yeojuensis]